MPLDFPSTPTLNQTYTFGGRSWKWNGDAWESVTSLITLDNLLDVTVSAPADGQVLKYNSASAVWINDSDLEGTTINSLDDIGDVTITSASAGQFLKWNGSAWVNSFDEVPTNTTITDEANFVTVASFPIATYRSAECLVQITQGSKYMVSKVLVIHNGTTARHNQYGIVEFGSPTQVDLIPLSVETDISSGNARLRLKITDANVTTAYVKVIMTNIVV